MNERWYADVGCRNLLLPSRSHAGTASYFDNSSLVLLRVAGLLADRDVGADLATLTDPAFGRFRTCLLVAGERIQVSDITGSYLLITESGRVLGHADNPRVIDTIAALPRHVPGSSDLPDRRVA